MHQHNAYKTKHNEACLQTLSLQCHDIINIPDTDSRLKKSPCIYQQSQIHQLSLAIPSFIPSLYGTRRVRWQGSTLGSDYSVQWPEESFLTNKARWKNSQ
jgi:hypothetical protein